MGRIDKDRIRRQLLMILPRRVLENLVAVEKPEYMDVGALRNQALSDWDGDTVDEIIKYVKSSL